MALTSASFLNSSLRQFTEIGELFLVRHQGPNFGPHKIQWQIFSADYVPHLYNATLDNGAYISSGIEYDVLGRVIAYYFTNNTQNSVVNYEDRTQRIPAKDVLHIYELERNDQGRGFTKLCACLEPLRHISEYQRSELVSARVASAKMGFYTRTANGDIDEFSSDDSEEDPGAFSSSLEPGTFDVLPTGYTITPLSFPGAPNASFPTFVKTILFGVAASLRS